jgi:hypothetical protein
MESGPYVPPAPLILPPFVIDFLLFEHNSSAMSVKMDIASLASDAWKALEAASLVEKPLSVKPFYDDVIKVEDPVNNKVMVDFKRPLELSCNAYNALPAKYNWNNTVRYSPFSTNKGSAEAPI